MPGAGMPVTRPGGAYGVLVGPVLLLGVPVTACVYLRPGEHEPRRALGLGEVTNPALLDRLLDLPFGMPVADPVTWVETSGLPPGIVHRAEDGSTVTRLLDSPLSIDSIVVSARRGREFQAVQNASLFAAFCTRWVAVGRRDTPVAAELEARLCGVGLLSPHGDVVVQAELPRNRTIDGWAWLLQEKAYRRWLRG